LPEHAIVRRDAAGRRHLGALEGIALHQAALIIPYYAVTNPDFVALAKRTVEEILTDG
jgi:hypothetical protein